MTEPDFDAQLQAFKRFVLQTLKTTGACTATINYQGANSVAEVGTIDLFGPNDTHFPFPNPAPVTMPGSGDDSDRTWPDVGDMLIDFTKDVIATHHDDDDAEHASGALTIDIENEYVTLERSRAVIHTDTVEV